jgi:aminoglycoside 3-N-acetyltransferase
MLQVLGTDGLLVVPSFTYTIPLFDPQRTPAATGAISEAARAWPGAVRSLHPTHSVVAIGGRAAQLCEGHEQTGALSHDSPLARAAAWSGQVLLAGVGHRANSTIHIGEAKAPAPYLQAAPAAPAPQHAQLTTREGVITVALTEPPGCSRAFGALEGPLRAGGKVSDGLLGAALTQLVSGAAVIATTIATLQHDATALLCTNLHCTACNRARACCPGPGSNAMGSASRGNSTSIL